MTTVYFVRHAEPIHSWEDDKTRPLTPDGKEDSTNLLNLFENVKIDAIYSSPYKRCIDTIHALSECLKLPIKTDGRLRERKVGIGSSNLELLIKRWENKSFAEDNGESIGSVQNRNIEALNEILTKNEDATIIIGTHGTALSTILNFYDGSFGYNDFLRIKYFMPYVLKCVFQGERLIEKCEELIVQKRGE
ncbi:MAG: histidine phosphatase family protein [Fibrobacteres bacterium]|nr:histidine phosphatase family protein [Fibrobacterota bacterium]